MTILTDVLPLFVVFVFESKIGFLFEETHKLCPRSRQKNPKYSGRKEAVKCSNIVREIGGYKETSSKNRVKTVVPDDHELKCSHIMFKI